MFNKNIHLSYFALAFALSAVSVVSADSYSNYNNNSNYNRNSNNQELAISDQELSKKIHDKIGSGTFSRGYENVNVQVNDGNVTLQGSVQTQADKDKVEKEVRNTEGVMSLVSRLTVQDRNSRDNKSSEFAQDSYNTAADDQLNKKIRDNVSKGWLWDSYKDVTLNTSNGVVTLEGTVNSPSDQQKLMTEIQKIEGVKQVKSNLQIKNAKAERDFTQDTYATAADEQLNKTIRDETSRGWLWNSYKNVALNTTNGAVTLEGSVDSVNDQKKLMTEIQKIDGVKSVKSNLKINNY